MVSSPYNKTQELIDEFCKHMPRGTFSWKYASSEEVINKFLSKCKTKSDTKQFDTNIKQKLSKWPQLSEALNYYNNLC